MATPRRSRRAPTGRNTVSLKVDMGAVNARVQELKDDMLGAVRPAAQAAAQVFYDVVLQNVDTLTKAVTGNLRSSIYQAFSESNSQPVGDGYSRATYHVSWNARKAPHGHLVEYGHIQKFKAYLGKDGKWYTNRSAPLPTPKQVPAHSFIRSAYHRQEEAAKAAEAVLFDRMGAK
jgi:hypothetical protein